MKLSRLAVVIELELRQRLRSVAWYVLMGIFAVALIGVTVLAFLMWRTSGNPADPYAGTGIYSTIVYFVLLLVTLVSPALSGNAVNGDRENATLAAVQVTKARTGEIIMGKFLAAWLTGLAFLAVSVPFILVAAIAGGIRPDVFWVSLGVLIVEIGVFAAIGVGLSALIARGLFSVVAAYLVVALLTVGTPIAFGLAGTAFPSEVTQRYRDLDENGECMAWETSTYSQPRFDRVWGVLALNPFVILADATPAHFSNDGYPEDLFSTLASGIRAAQIPPESVQETDYCTMSYDEWDYDTPQEIYDKTVPSWFVGLAVHVLLAAGLLVWGAARTHTPARRLPPGTRIA